MSDMDSQSDEEMYSRRSVLGGVAAAPLLFGMSFDFFGPNLLISQSGEDVIGDPSEIVIGSGLTATKKSEEAVTLSTTNTSTGATNPIGWDFAASEGGVTISSGSTLTIGRYTAPSDASAEVHRAGVKNASNQSPSGLSVQLQQADGTVVYNSSAEYEEGSPLASAAVSGDLEVVLINETSSTQDGVMGHLKGVFE